MQNSVVAIRECPLCCFAFFGKGGTVPSTQFALSFT